MLVIQTVDCDWKCKWENNAKQRDEWTSGWCAFCQSGAFLWISLGLSARGSHRLSRRKRRPQSSESSKIINPQSAGLMMFLQTLHVGHLTRMTQQWSGPSGCFSLPSLTASLIFPCLQQTNSFPSWNSTHTRTERERSGGCLREVRIRSFNVSHKMHYFLLKVNML